ncbi:hypothetical protein [Vibrio crassostreae]|uniref:hypothetical protein n=1 Tax=Vibrio crassostreae TaxID=246167 RepID=UPI001B301516|nr:hypothetical protein [Vibrio crassostreae]
MATVYGLPEGFEPPAIDWKLPYTEQEKKEDEFVAKLATFCKENSNCKDAGEEIRFPVADGYARYMVFDYRKIVHLPLGDAWQIPEAHSRGLRKADIVKNIEGRKAMAELFGSSRNKD